MLCRVESSRVCGTKHVLSSVFLCFRHSAALARSLHLSLSLSIGLAMRYVFINNGAKEAKKKKKEKKIRISISLWANRQTTKYYKRNDERINSKEIALCASVERTLHTLDTRHRYKNESIFMTPAHQLSSAGCVCVCAVEVSIVWSSVRLSRMCERQQQQRMATLSKTTKRH